MKQLSIILFVLTILALATMVHADVSLVDPVVQKAKPNGMLDAGSISPGERVEIIFSRNTGYGRDVLWEQAQLTVEGEAGGIQTTNSEIGSDSLITMVQTSPFTREGEYTFQVKMIGDQGTLENETFTLILRVQKGLLKGSLSAENVTGGVNQPLTFSVLLVNDSSAPVTVRVEPALPQVWSTAQTVPLKAHSFSTVPVVVTPRFAGPKTFEIKLIRVDNQATVDTLNATLVANPTLKDRYAAGLYGFPFFAISLASHYLANAFFSFLL